MFTGIVEELGTVRAVDSHASMAITVDVAAAKVLSDVSLGASIAVNGCCLTVVAWGDDWCRFEVSDETAARTTLGDLVVGEPVNLERPLAIGERLGGHIVLGHVDGVGEVVRPAPELQVRVPASLMRYVVEKGSVTVDGVSLTVFGLVDGPQWGTVDAAIIDHTAAATTLGRRRAGDRVNLEADVLAKHVERLVAPGAAAPA